MSAVNFSPLHLISAIINVPQFHQDVSHVPHEITVQCIRLLISLSNDEDFSFSSNVEMVSFLAKNANPIDDDGYKAITTYFTKQLLTFLKPNDPIWGAIAYVMASVADVFQTSKERNTWCRLCGLLFQILKDCGVISPEMEAKLKRGMQSDAEEADAEDERRADDLLISKHEEERPAQEPPAFSPEPLPESPLTPKTEQVSIVGKGMRSVSVKSAFRR